jgi:hypothetical protein
VSRDSTFQLFFVFSVISVAGLVFHPRLSALMSTGQRNTSDPMMDKEVGHGKKSELKL